MDQFNYIEVSLETHLDSLFTVCKSIVKEKQIVSVVDALSFYSTQDISSVDKWRWVFEDMTILYFACMLNTAVKELVELGYPHIIKAVKEYLGDENKLSNDLETLHMNTKEYILLNVIVKTPSYLDDMYNKYIDKCFPDLTINLYTYEYRKQSKTSSLILNLFSSMSNQFKNSQLDKLIELVEAGHLRIYSMFIRLINGLNNQSTFKTMIESKINKISAIYNSNDKKKTFKLFSSEWKSNSDFTITYNFSNMNLIRLNVPFYPINDQIQLSRRIPIIVNGTYELNTNLVPIDYIVYQNKKLIELSQVEFIYENYLISKLLQKVSLTDIRFLREQTILHTQKMKDTISELYFSKYTKNGNILENFIREVMRMNIKIDHIQPSIPFICVHESLLDELNHVTTIKEYKLILSQLTRLTPNQICNVCSAIVRIDSEDVVMYDEIELLEEYSRLADFIKFTRIVIERIGKIFDVLILTQNQDHRNYIIQNMLELITASKNNEEMCSKFVNQNEFSLYFIFAPTNNLYIQELSVDKYVYRKMFNINIIILILIICNYTIKTKFEFSMYYDEFRPICQNAMNNMGIRLNQNILSLFTFITVFIIRYKLLYSENIDSQQKLKDRIKLYGAQVFQCLMDHCVVLFKLGSILPNTQLLKRQSERLVNVLSTYKNVIENNIFFTSNYSNFLLNMKFHGYEFIKAFRFSRIIYKHPFVNLDMKRSLRQCHIFCNDGVVHQLDNIKQGLAAGKIICKRCSSNIFICDNKIVFSKNIKMYINELVRKSSNIPIYSQMSNLVNSICKNNENSFENLRTTLSKQILLNELDRLFRNVNDNNKNLYTRIWMRRDILKITLDGINIYMSTSSKSFTLFWLSGRLMNSEFPDVQVHANFTRLGWLLFNKQKSIDEFKEDMTNLVISSVTSTISKGSRTNGLALLKIIYSLKHLEIDETLNYEFQYFVPTSVITSTFTSCILLNDVFAMLKFLCILTWILNMHSSLFLSTFIDALNKYIDKIIESATTNSEDPTIIRNFFTYNGPNYYPVNMFHRKFK